MHCLATACELNTSAVCAAQAMPWDQSGSVQVMPDDVEAAFWKVVESSDEPVEVLYGADLDTGVVGSGFPCKVSRRARGGVLGFRGVLSLAALPGSLLGMCWTSWACPVVSVLRVPAATSPSSCCTGCSSLLSA